MNGSVNLVKKPPVMSFSMLHLTDDTIEEHVFERYIELGTHVDDLPQDLGIQDRVTSTISIDIEPSNMQIESPPPSEKRQ